MGLKQWLREAGLLIEEDRTLTRDTVPAAMLPYSRSALQDVSTANALRVADAYSCVRALSDSVASLPAHVFRRTAAGRVPAGDDQRLVQLLRRPAPGSTSADLFGQIMVHLNVLGECFVGKYRTGDEITQLALLHRDRVGVELRGPQIVYTLDGQTEHGPGDILHVKGMSSDGLRGLSPVSQCRLALSLSANLQEHAKQYFENGSRPSGILTLPDGTGESAVARMREDWRNEQTMQARKLHSIAVITGDANFTPVAFSADDSQFLQQRELSAREVARIFRVPAWIIDAGAGDSMTYSNVTDNNRHFVAHSLRPWLVRIERAFSNDTDLCPGGAYLQFDLDGLLRADPAQRAQIYQAGLDPISGWLTRSEVRELEELPPEPEPTPQQRMTEAVQAATPGASNGNG